MIKLNISSNKINQHYVISCMMYWMGHKINSMAFSPKMYNFNLSYEKTSDKLKLRDILQNNYLVFFQTCMSKTEELSENIGTWQPNEMREHRLHNGPEKGHL